jgi:hypothetical protein
LTASGRYHRPVDSRSMDRSDRMSSRARQPPRTLQSLTHFIARLPVAPPPASNVISSVY